MSVSTAARTSASSTRACLNNSPMVGSVAMGRNLVRARTRPRRVRNRSPSAPTLALPAANCSDETAGWPRRLFAPQQPVGPSSTPAALSVTSGVALNRGEGLGIGFLGRMGMVRALIELAVLVDLPAEVTHRRVQRVNLNRVAARKVVRHQPISADSPGRRTDRCWKGDWSGWDGAAPPPP